MTGGQQMNSPDNWAWFDPLPDPLPREIKSRGVPGDVDVMGLALATNTVSVNGSNAYRKWEYFREQIAVSNTSAALWTNMTVSAPGQATNMGHVFVAQNPENFTYDADGKGVNP
jgi:hypothetical protein